jgi:hypothetical protein
MLKAYYVTEINEEHGEIVFADTSRQSKQRADLDCEYIDRRARREPRYDKYADACEVPKEVLFNDGWWFTCDKCFEYHVSKENGGRVISREVYCSECALKVTAHE